jgi:hypothetical protein
MGPGLVGVGDDIPVAGEGISHATNPFPSWRRTSRSQIMEVSDMRNYAVPVALGLGIVYVLVGLVGFAITGLDGFAHTDGPSLLFFEINPLHNLVHIGVGAGLIAGAVVGAAGLRMVATIIGAVYALVGVVGFFVVGTSANILALNVADHVLHLGSAAVLFWVAAQTPRPAEV